MSPVYVTDFGTAKIVADRMYASGAKTDTLRDAMDLIFLNLLEITKTQIESGGRRGGGSYAQLKEDTVRKKGNSEILKTEGSNEIYDRIDNNALFRSVTEKGAMFQIWHKTNEGFEFGTDRPYAFVHQYGSAKRRIPARPFLRILPGDVGRFEFIIAQHILEPFDKPTIEGIP